VAQVLLADHIFGGESKVLHTSDPSTHRHTHTQTHTDTHRYTDTHTHTHTHTHTPTHPQVFYPSDPASKVFVPFVNESDKATDIYVKVFVGARSSSVFHIFERGCVIYVLQFERLCCTAVGVVNVCDVFELCCF